MSKKKQESFGGLVYSTDPHFQLPGNNKEEKEPLQVAEQKLKLYLDTKHRAGKAVTLVAGFIGKKQDLDELGKKLKTYCGTGGSVKEGEIIIQGDNRDKVLHWLLANGFSSAKKI